MMLNDKKVKEMFMTRKARAINFNIAILVFLISNGCGNEVTTGSAKIELYVGSNSNIHSLRTLSSLELQGMIDKLIVSIWRDNTILISKVFHLETTMQEIIINRIPAGKERIFKSELVTVEDEVIYTGKTEHVEVMAGRTIIVKIYMYKSESYDYDIFPPSEVMDLEVEVISNDGIRLTWTATGDDGFIGKASCYDLRTSFANIEEGNFESAQEIEGLPVPGSSGEKEEFVIVEFQRNKTYYFAIKVIDDEGNTSAISNVVNVTIQ